MSVEVPCSLRSISDATIRPAAAVTTGCGGQLITTAYTFADGVGFLTATSLNLPGLVAELGGPTTARSAIPLSVLSTYHGTEIAAARDRIRQAATAYALATPSRRIYAIHPEPCLVVQARFGISWTSVSIDVRSAPTVSEAATGERLHYRRYFSARDVEGARALALQIARGTLDDVHIDGSIMVEDATVFTFDPAHWHACNAVAYVVRRLEELRTALIPDDQEVGCAAEYLVLARRLDALATSDAFNPAAIARAAHSEPATRPILRLRS